MKTVYGWKRENESEEAEGQVGRREDAGGQERSEVVGGKGLMSRRKNKREAEE